MLTLNNNVCLPHVEVGHAERAHLFEKRLPSVSSSRRKTSMMAISVSDICENTKLAREMSLLGNYETASVYYQGVVQQIHRLLGSIDDPVRKMKWQQIQGEVRHA